MADRPMVRAIHGETGRAALVGQQILDVRGRCFPAIAPLQPEAPAHCSRCCSLRSPGRNVVIYDSGIGTDSSPGPHRRATAAFVCCQRVIGRYEDPLLCYLPAPATTRDVRLFTASSDVRSCFSFCDLPWDVYIHILFVTPKHRINLLNTHT